MRHVIQWSELIPREWLGADAQAWHDRGVRFYETLWTDPAQRVRYCSAQCQIERFTVRHEFATIGGVDLTDDENEAIDDLCRAMTSEGEGYSLGGTSVPDGVSIEFDDDATDDDVNEELNANWRNSLPKVQS